jgi:hypothetical protein
MNRPLPAAHERGTAALLHFPQRPAKHDWFSLWHLLSLDAPTVAALWVIFVAKSVHVMLPWVSPLCMFLAVWMLYAADRLLDARDLRDACKMPHGSGTGDGPRESQLEERHLFHHSHRRTFTGMMAGVSLLLSSLVPRLAPAALHLYAALAILLAAYFFLIHITLRSATRLPKELAVGVFFAAAVFIPTVARQPLLRPALLHSAVLFAAVCTLNCLYLYAWEHPGDRTAAHATTRFATAHLGAITATLLVAEIAIAMLSRSSATLAIACALSTLLLFTLHQIRWRLKPVHLRAAADLALLTPLLLLPFLR